MLYTAVNVSLYAYTIAEAQTNRLVSIRHSQRAQTSPLEAEVEMGIVRSWGKTFPFYSALFYVVLIFIMKFILILLMFQNKRWKLIPSCGHRDVTAHNSSIASHKQVIDGSPHTSHAQPVNRSYVPLGKTYYRFYATSSHALYLFPLQVLVPPVHYCS